MSNHTSEIVKSVQACFLLPDVALKVLEDLLEERGRELTGTRNDEEQAAEHPLPISDEEAVCWDLLASVEYVRGCKSFGLLQDGKRAHMVEQTCECDEERPGYFKTFKTGRGYGVLGYVEFCGLCGGFRQTTGYVSVPDEVALAHEEDKAMLTAEDERMWALQAELDAVSAQTVEAMLDYDEAPDGSRKKGEAQATLAVLSDKRVAIENAMNAEMDSWAEKADARQAGE